jgi:hypothetical protein
MDKQEQQSKQPSVDATRRRLTQAGLAAPVVLATLASKNALAAAPYSCTISGQLSGNASTHGDTANCNTLGLSPGHWRQPQWAGDWAYSSYVQGNGMVDGNFKPIKSPTLDGSKQSTEGTLFTTAGFANVFRCVSTSSGVTILAFGEPGFPTPGNATLEQVVACGGNAGGLISLGRAAVGSLLNAFKFAPNYPLTPNDVVQMFNAVCMGGTYQVNATTFWTADQVKAYFETLYS